MRQQVCTLLGLSVSALTHSTKPERYPVLASFAHCHQLGRILSHLDPGSTDSVESG